MDQTDSDEQGSDRVAKMTYSQSISILGPEFDDFLFAPIGEEKNGMLLRVVSVLARLDLDARQETANLARLPRQEASERLAEFIGALPDRPSAALDTRAIAADLIARLPPQPAANARSAEHPAGLGILAATQLHPFFYMAIILMALMVNLALAGSQGSTVAADKASVSTTSKVVAHPVMSAGDPQ